MPSELISRVLAADIVGVESRVDVDVELFASEAAYIAGAPEGRRREYATVRWCARRALAEAGLRVGPLVPSAEKTDSFNESSLWPSGSVGSMTHCDGYRGAAVAPTRAVIALGIDAEPHRDVSEHVRRRLFTAGERDHCNDLERQRGDIAWGCIVFSAKESVFKALHPLTSRWFDLRDCIIALEADGDAFTAELQQPALRELGFGHVSGRWTAESRAGVGVVVTSALIR